MAIVARIRAFDARLDPNMATSPCRDRSPPVPRALIDLSALPVNRACYYCQRLGNLVFFLFSPATEPTMEDIITLACGVCKRRNYTTVKNKKNAPDRLEMSKYCRWCHKHTAQKETQEWA